MTGRWEQVGAVGWAECGVGWGEVGWWGEKWASMECIILRNYGNGLGSIEIKKSAKSHLNLTELFF